MYTKAIFVLFLIYLEICACVPVDDELEKLEYDIIVRTSDGKVGGSAIRSNILNKTFYAFQSIPYAKAPIGKRRFEDPVAISKWKGVLNATKTPKACPQPSLPESDMSEDCLFLNIFTPSPKPRHLLPVIFWIHGGYFQIGAGDMLNCRPDLFVNENVIFVSINYRLGVFGYLSAEDEVLSGNYGIKDQILALKWVHHNIAKFGGHPSKITLMGQSAGAASIGLLLQTSSTKGLFSAAILESGNSLNLWSRSLNPKSLTKKIADIFKIKYNNNQELRNELRKIKWTDLVFGANTVFVMDTALSNPANGLTIGPSIESHKNGILTGTVHENFKKGKFNKVPVLTGYNSGEANIFIPMFDKLTLFLKMYDIIPSKLAPIDLNVNSSMLNTIGRSVKSFYFGSESITKSVESFSNYITDHEFLRPVHEFVRLLSKFKHTYFYRFAYVGQLPAQDKTLRELPGPAHCEELEYLFYSPNQNQVTAKDLLTRQRLIKLWTNFAKYHNPTPHREPLFQYVTWKPVRPDQINYLDIDTDLRILRNPNKKNMDFWTSIYNSFGVPPFDTY